MTIHSDLYGELVVNCDWLQYSVLLNDTEPELECPDGFRLEILQGNNIYRNRAILYDARGAKWMTLLWSPYSSLLDGKVATVQVANQLLYCGLIEDSFTILKRIWQCEFNSLGRVDICCDFQASDRQIDILKRLNAGNYYVVGKHEGSAFWHHYDKSGDAFCHKDIHCQSWGAKTSKTKVKVYYKSREVGLLDAQCQGDGDKPWIVNQWRSAGLDVQKVWRCEFALEDVGQRRNGTQQVTLKDVAESPWLLGTMRQLLDTRFDIRINQGRRHGHKNEDARVEFLSIPIGEGCLRWRTPSGETDTPEGIKMLRKLMGEISLPTCRCDVSVYDAYASAVRALVQSQYLDGYFKRTYGMRCDDYLTEQREGIGTGMYEGVDIGNRFWE